MITSDFVTFDSISILYLEKNKYSRIIGFFTDRLVVDFINQYWPYIYREVLPESRSIWEPLAVAEANKFLLHVPIKKILYFSDEV